MQLPVCSCCFLVTVQQKHRLPISALNEVEFGVRSALKTHTGRDNIRRNIPFFLSPPTINRPDCCRSSSSSAFFYRRRANIKSLFWLTVLEVEGEPLTGVTK